MQSSISLQSKSNKLAPAFFEIHSLERLSQSNLEQMGRQHLQQYFEMLWIREGSCGQIINGQKYLLESCNMHCTIPGQQHQLCIDAGIKGYIISFNEAFLNGCYEDFNKLQETSFFRIFSQTAPLEIADDNAADIEELLQKLVKENENQFHLKNEILSKYLKILLIYVRRQFETLPANSIRNNNILFNNFLSLLENNYKQKKAVADYAKEMSVTPSYLNHVIKKTSGYPASHHIQQRIVLEAKRKVTHTDASMKEVAYYLGFDDIYHFSKFFKTSSGMNFTAFKNSSRAERA